MWNVVNRTKTSTFTLSPPPTSLIFWCFRFWADHLGFDKFITVNNWGEVKDKIQPYLNNPEELDKLWHETNSWFFCFLRKMQNDIAQVITTNYLSESIKDEG